MIDKILTVCDTTIFAQWWERVLDASCHSHLLFHGNLFGRIRWVAIGLFIEMIIYILNRMSLHFFVCMIFPKHILDTKSLQ